MAKNIAQSVIRPMQRALDDVPRLIRPLKSKFSGQGKKSGKNKKDTERNDRYDGGGSSAGSGSSKPDGSVLELRHKKNATPEQKAEMLRKAEAFNEGVRESGFQRVEGSQTRSASMKDKFLAALGLDKTPAGLDVDHIVDLQAGGLDIPENMMLLDRGVNRSFGAQLMHAMKGYGSEVRFSAVRIVG